MSESRPLTNVASFEKVPSWLETRLMLLLRSTFYIDELFLREISKSKIVSSVCCCCCCCCLFADPRQSILFDFAQQIVHDAFVPVAFYTCNDVFINKIVAIYNSARRMVPVHTY